MSPGLMFLVINNVGFWVTIWICAAKPGVKK